MLSVSIFLWAIMILADILDDRLWVPPCSRQHLNLTWWVHLGTGKVHIASRNLLGQWPVAYVGYELLLLVVGRGHACSQLQVKRLGSPNICRSLLIHTSIFHIPLQLDNFHTFHTFHTKFDCWYSSTIPRLKLHITPPCNSCGSSHTNIIGQEI